HYSKDDDIVLWGGDLNTVPDSNLIAYLKDKSYPKIERLHYNHETCLKYEKEIFLLMENLKDEIFQWGNLYEFYNGSLGNTDGNNFPKFTNYTKNFRETIDHLFYNIKRIVPKQLLELPTLEKLK